jgi:antitoxin component YwqK of YwqJK toxin-antitoxin module
LSGAPRRRKFDAPSKQCGQGTPMPKKPKPFEKLHRDGTLWARGQTIDGVATGYWEWFRKDGSKLRSGYFIKGEQSGDWTTYDRDGMPYKVTRMKPKKG